MKPKFALLAPAFFLLVSCGGSGGNAPVHPATTFRSNNIGDSWNYSVSINFGIFGAYFGTMNQALTTDTYNGQPSIRNTQVFNLVLKTGPATLTSYSEISPQGAFLATTVNNVLFAVTGDTFFVGNSIGLTTSTTGVISLSNGETMTETYRVIGAEQVGTRAGTFNCWIVSQKVAYSTGASDDFTLWIAPEIGNFVRISDKTIKADGTGYTYVATLTSLVTSPPPPGATSVPLSSWQTPHG